MPYKVLSFDFVGTLAKESTEDRLIFKEVLKKLGHEANENDIRLAIERAKDWWRAEKASGKIWNEDNRFKFIDQVLVHLKIGPSLNMVERASDLMVELSKYEAYDDVSSILQQLHNEGYKLIVISNVSSIKNLSRYISKVNLAGYFDLLVASGTVGFEKPDKRIFLWASSSINVKPQEIFHVGDDYQADYLGAVACGMGAALLDRSGKHSDKVAVKIRSLVELPEIIQW